MLGRRTLRVASAALLPSKLTLFSQYNAIKERYKDYIVLFQNGDFYEIFGDDAGWCSS